MDCKWLHLLHRTKFAHDYAQGLGGQDEEDWVPAFPSGDALPSSDDPMDLSASDGFAHNYERGLHGQDEEDWVPLSPGEGPIVLFYGPDPQATEPIMTHLEKAALTRTRALAPDLRPCHVVHLCPPPQHATAQAVVIFVALCTTKPQETFTAIVHGQRLPVLSPSIVALLQDI
ncbi:hypothetical protein MKEN_00326200 [Mycena kentingensis (nom. inval.)]|nr:hypothetical protein MKEN_00326200 [Mycena kentingensis (nom. inval.)]